MFDQATINLMLGAVCAVIGWLGRELWSAVKELKADLAKLREELPIHYVRKDEFQDIVKEIKSSLDKILDKLDNKQDK